MSSNSFEEESDIALHKRETNYGTFKEDSLDTGRNLNESEISGNRIKVKKKYHESDQRNLK